MRNMTSALLTLGLIAAAPAIAQEAGADAKAKQEKPAKQEPLPPLVRASDAIGAKVKTGTQENAETIGDIEDLIVNATTGEALFGIVSTGGFLGLGETRTAVPYDLLVWRQQPGSEKGVVVLETTKQKLASAPKFDAAKLDHCLSDEAWRKETVGAFGSCPRLEKPGKTAEATGKQGEPVQRSDRIDRSATEASAKDCGYRMASKLRSSAVRGSDDKIGGVDELIMDRKNRKITYAITDDRPIPWTALSLRGEDLHVAKTKEQFKNAPKLEKDAVARLTNEEFCARVMSFWGVDKK
jgi:hypothetical protein